jgi:hypothetical protein
VKRIQQYMMWALPGARERHINHCNGNGNGKEKESRRLSTLNPGSSFNLEPQQKQRGTSGLSKIKPNGQHVA